MDSFDKTEVLIITFYILLVVGILYLDGTGKAILLKETKGIELPWYYAVGIKIHVTNNHVVVGD